MGPVHKLRVSFLLEVILAPQFHSYGELHVSEHLLFLCFYRIAECFAFLVCTKWSNPVIHRDSQTREESSSSSAIRYLDWNSGLVVPSEDHLQDRVCGLQDIGGHIMKIPIIVFQVLLCMKLEVHIMAPLTSSTELNSQYIF